MRPFSLIPRQVVNTNPQSPYSKSLGELAIITRFPYNNILAELKIALKCTVILYMIPKHDSATQIPGARHPLPMANLRTKTTAKR